MADQPLARPISRGVVVVGAIVVPVAIVAALIPLREHASTANLALGLVLVVLGAAVIGGRLAGVVAGIATALAFDFFLTVPYQSLSISNGEDVATTVLLGLVGLAGGELVERARRSAEEARARQAEVTRVRRQAELVAGGESPGRLITLTSAELKDLLGLTDVTYHPGPAPAGMAVLTHWGVSIPGRADRAGADVAALPVRGDGREVGHFVLQFPTAHAGTGISSDDRYTAVAMADQLGVGLARQP